MNSRKLKSCARRNSNCQHRAKADMPKMCCHTWLDKPHPHLQRAYGSDDATGTGEITDYSDVEWKLKMLIMRT